MAQEDRRGFRLKDAFSFAQVWTRTLIREHLNANERLALFQTCTETQKVVQCEAASCTIHLQLSLDIHEQALSRFTSALLRVCQLRNTTSITGVHDTPTRTSLVVGSATSPRLWAFIHQLGDVPLTITGLKLYMPEQETLPVQLLQLIGQTCPYLVYLCLVTRTCKVEALPNVGVFPQLRELVIREPEDSSTLQPYLAQLEKLIFKGRVPGVSIVTMLQSMGDGECARLKTLVLESLDPKMNQDSLKQPLTDPLLEQLSRCAPALTTLHFPCMRLQSTPTPTPTQQHQMQLARVSLVAAINLNSLAYLPQPPPGSTTCVEVSANRFDVDVATAEQAAALTQAARRIRIKPGQPAGSPSTPQWLKLRLPLHAEEEALALRSALDLVRTSADPAEHSGLFLEHFEITVGVLDELRHLPLSYTRVGFKPVRWMVWDGMGEGHDAVWSRLLRVLPPSYKNVDVCVPENLDVRQPVLELCLGAPLHHHANDPLCITLLSAPTLAARSAASDLCQEIQDRMRSAGSNYQGVVVRTGKDLGWFW